MSRSSRAATVYLGILLVVFVGAAVAGFVYQYGPERDVLVITVDRTTLPGDVPREVFASGTVEEFADGRLVLRTESGLLEFSLAPGTPIEALQRLPGDAVVEGMRVNIGAERTQFGLVLTGVVALEGTP